MDRIEYKIDIHQSKKNEFLSFLTKHDAKVLFEKRLITSIYFDNEKFEMYQDSVEGLSPRKKIKNKSLLLIICRIRMFKMKTS